MRNVLKLLLALFAVMTPATARATLDDPDTEAAKRHYERGVELYDSKNYAGALAEFETAKRVKPLAAFDYNIARCLDRLERYEEAIQAYDRYVITAPNPEEARKVVERIAILKMRLEAAKPIPEKQEDKVIVNAESPRDRPAGPSLAMPLAIGMGALVSLATGTGLYFSIDGELARLNRECVRPCQDAALGGLRDREIAAYAILGAGAIAAAAAVALGARYAVIRRRVATVSIVPAGNGLAVAGTW